MLRISVVTGIQGTTLTLEGRLTAPWVDELAACWSTAMTARDARAIFVRLDAVTFVDEAGKALLRTMHEHGTTLEASGCMTRATLDEIQKGDG